LSSAPAADLLQSHHSAVEAAFVREMADATLVATGDQDGRVQLLQFSKTAGWQPFCNAKTEVGPIGDLSISPDGRYLAVAGEASRAGLIQLRRAAENPARAEAASAQESSPPPLDGCGPYQPLDGHSGRVYSVAFSPDSAQLVTASLDKTARLWNNRGQPLAILAGHQDRIYRAEFSPDGDWLLTGSRDRSIRIWRRPREVDNPVRVLSTFLPLEADAGGVANAVFSPDGHYVVGAYWENTAILWRLWSEAAELTSRDRSEWGKDRSKLALVQEAYRFAQDNRPATPQGPPQEAPVTGVESDE
jgi:WD40 repeat protein